MTDPATPTNPTPSDLAVIAKGLSKASKRAIVRISHVNFTEEGYPGPARKDVYSLWWGRDGKHKLVERPQAYAFSDVGCCWKWRLTPLGLAVRQHIYAQESSHDD